MARATDYKNSKPREAKAPAFIIGRAAQCELKQAAKETCTDIFAYDLD